MRDIGILDQNQKVETYISYIKYQLNKKRFSKIYPGADVDSDHNLVIVKCRPIINKIIKKQQRKRFGSYRLKETDIRLNFEQAIETRLNNFTESTSTKKDVLERLRRQVYEEAS